MELSSLPSTIGIMAPVFITGGIWFSVSFKGMSTRYLDSAINVVFLVVSIIDYVDYDYLCCCILFVQYICIYSFLSCSVKLLASTIIYDNLDLLRKD